jgi:hypothetical protein
MTQLETELIEVLTLYMKHVINCEGEDYLDNCIEDSDLSDEQLGFLESISAGIDL